MTVTVNDLEYSTASPWGELVKPITKESEEIFVFIPAGRTIPQKGLIQFTGAGEKDAQKCFSCGIPRLDCNSDCHQITMYNICSPCVSNPGWEEFALYSRADVVDLGCSYSVWRLSGLVRGINPHRCDLSQGDATDPCDGSNIADPALFAKAHSAGAQVLVNPFTKFSVCSLWERLLSIETTIKHIQSFGANAPLWFNWETMRIGLTLSQKLVEYIEYPDTTLGENPGNILTVYNDGDPDNTDNGLYASFTAKYFELTPNGKAAIAFFAPDVDQVLGNQFHTLEVPATLDNISGKYFAYSPETVEWYQQNDPVRNAAFVTAGIEIRNDNPVDPGQNYYARYVEFILTSSEGEISYIMVPMDNFLLVDQSSQSQFYWDNGVLFRSHPDVIEVDGSGSTITVNQDIEPSKQRKYLILLSGDGTKTLDIVGTNSKQPIEIIFWRQSGSGLVTFPSNSRVNNGYLPPVTNTVGNFSVYDIVYLETPNVHLVFPVGNELRSIV